MEIIYIVIIIFLLGIVIFLTRNGQLKNKSVSTPDGFLKQLKERKDAKERNKEQVMELLRQNGRTTNQEAQDKLGVSDATATRYLDELEKEGKIVQKDAGKDTYYVIR